MAKWMLALSVTLAASGQSIAGGEVYYFTDSTGAVHGRDISNPAEAEKFYRQLLVAHNVAQGAGSKVLETLKIRQNQYLNTANDIRETANDVQSNVEDAQQNLSTFKQGATCKIVSGAADTTLEITLLANPEGAGIKAIEVAKDIQAAKSVASELKDLKTDQEIVKGAVAIRGNLAAGDLVSAAANMAKTSVKIDPDLKGAAAVGNAVNFVEDASKGDRVSALTDAVSTAKNLEPDPATIKGFGAVESGLKIVKGVKIVSEGISDIRSANDDAERLTQQGNDAQSKMSLQASKMEAGAQRVHELSDVVAVGSSEDADRIRSELESRYPDIPKKVDKESLQTASTQLRSEVARQVSLAKTDDAANAGQLYLEGSKLEQQNSTQDNTNLVASGGTEKTDESVQGDHSEGSRESFKPEAKELLQKTDLVDNSPINKIPVEIDYNNHTVTYRTVKAETSHQFASEIDFSTDEMKVRDPESGQSYDVITETTSLGTDKDGWTTLLQQAQLESDRTKDLSGKSGGPEVTSEEMGWSKKFSIALKDLDNEYNKDLWGDVTSGKQGEETNDLISAFEKEAGRDLAAVERMNMATKEISQDTQQQLRDVQQRWNEQLQEKEIRQRQDADAQRALQMQLDSFKINSAQSTGPRQQTVDAAKYRQEANEYRQAADKYREQARKLGGSDKGMSGQYLQAANREDAAAAQLDAKASGH